MTPLTPERIAELRGIAEKANKGRWEFERVGFDDGSFAYEINTEFRLIQLSEYNYDSPSQAKFDADFLEGFSPSQSLELLAEIERLREANKHLDVGLRDLVEIRYVAGSSQEIVADIFRRRALEALQRALNLSGEDEP